MNEHNPLPQPFESIVQLVALPMIAALAFLFVLIVNIGSLLLMPLIAILQRAGDCVLMRNAGAGRSDS